MVPKIDFFFTFMDIIVSLVFTKKMLLLLFRKAWHGTVIVTELESFMHCWEEQFYDCLKCTLTLVVFLTCFGAYF